MGGSSFASDVHVQNGAILVLSGTTTWSAGILHIESPTSTVENVGSLSISGDVTTAGDGMLHNAAGGALARGGSSGFARIVGPYKQRSRRRWMPALKADRAKWCSSTSATRCRFASRARVMSCSGSIAESVQGAGFRVDNPNVIAARGRGSSFRLAEERKAARR